MLNLASTGRWQLSPRISICEMRLERLRIGKQGQALSQRQRNGEGLGSREGDAITGGGGSKGGDIKYEIASLRAGLSDSKVSQLYGETLIAPKKGLKSIAKAGKKEGYKFDKKELGAALDEMMMRGFQRCGTGCCCTGNLMGLGGAQQQAVLPDLNALSPR